MDVEWHGLRLKPCAVSETDSGKPAWRGNLHFSAWDVICLVLAIISVLTDVASDCYVAYVHAVNERTIALWLTIAFIVIPGWLSTCASLLMISQDRNNRIKSEWSYRWLAFFHVLPLVLIPRYINTIKYGLKSQQDTRPRSERQMWYYRMLWEDYDASFLRLIEAFLEAGPQLLLQSVLLLLLFDELRDEPSYYWPHLIFPMTLSLFSLSYAIVCYKRSLRISQSEKTLSTTAIITLLCSQVCLVASRLIVLALFISVSPLEVIAAALVFRILFNILWLSIFQTFSHADSFCEGFLLRCVLSVTYLFTYIDFSAGQTGRRQLIHHVATVFDCGILLALYTLYATRINVYCVVAAICSYPLGLMLLVFYYCKCHPTSMSDGVHFIEVSPTQS